MNYILINRNNVVVDIISERIRYIKLQPSTSYVIACEENEGTGVIGSDNDTHYTLIKSDTQHNENAVKIIAVEEIPSEVSINNSVYNAETNEFENRYSLEEAQIMKQEENKIAFANYLESHPLTWVDGKTYGVTETD
jgi:hypothetical protein